MLIYRDETMPLAADRYLAVYWDFENQRLFTVICDDYLISPEAVSEYSHKTRKPIFELWDAVPELLRWMCQ